MQENTSIFNTSDEVLMGGKKFLIERHFTGKQDFRQAVFTTVENETKRAEPQKNPRNPLIVQGKIPFEFAKNF